jgi:hypothetical protein
MGRVEAINRDMGSLAPLQSVDIPSLEGRVSAEEWKIRVDLAAAYRLISPPASRGRSIISCSTPTTSCSRR